MGTKVFERAMFQQANKPSKADSGIMEGFDVEDEEIPEDEMMEEVSARRPNSPEILMNNLRGDMRSVDARYDELAQMVGQDVAMETPPEVLALLQAQMAQPAGIGALPPGQGMSPPPTMPPGAAPMPTPDMMGGMPPGPEGQMPQGFAYGGMVGQEQGGLGSMMSILQGNRGGSNYNPLTMGPDDRPMGSSGSMGEGPLGKFNSVNTTTQQNIMGRGLAEQPLASVMGGGFGGGFGGGGSGGAFPLQGQYGIVKMANGGLAEGGPVHMFSGGLGIIAKILQSGAFSKFKDMKADSGSAPAQISAVDVMNRGESESPSGISALFRGKRGSQGSNYSGSRDFSEPTVNAANGGYIGNFSEGVASAGRNGDTALAHITPEQHQYLTELGGGATVNPQTGLPEHYMGMQALGNMGTALATRAAPYLQQANVLAGRALYNPTFTAPTINQTRTTLGTFGPKVAEGMEMYYPTFTQGIANSRVGQLVTQGAERLSKTPAAAKLGAAVMAIPGAGYVRDALDNPNLSTANNNPPVIPGDPATGWKAPEEEVVGESTPINYNNLPKPPAAAPAPGSEAERNNQVIQNAIAKKTRGERLEDYMSENVPIFEKYLGGDKNYNQAQALFVLADMGLKLAQPRKRGESFASTLARSAQGVPAGLSTIAAAEDQAKRQIKGAALTSGLQALAAEDKAIADLQKEIIKKGVSAGELIPTDLGGGLTTYRKKDGQPAGMRVDETVTNSFLNSKFTPQPIKDDKGQITGFDTPYVRISPPAQTVNLDKGTRERLAGEVSRHEQAMAAIDDAIKEYSGAFGPKAFFSNLKNNVLVPVSPLDPNVMTEQQKTKINMAINIATKAIAKTGDTGNIAVAEQRAASDILGDKPGTFFSDPETALKRMMTVRTSLANQRLNTASQLGWLNQDIQLEVPNLGTVSDPIPQDKMTYLKSMAKTFPNGQVYVNIGGKTTPVLLSTLKD